MHRRNYRKILVDETDWIYIEFLNSYSKNDLNLCSSHFLCRFLVKSFNLFSEYFTFKTKNDNKCVKIFHYLQTDLVSNEIEYLSWSEVESIQMLSEDSQIFFLITQELIKSFSFKKTLIQESNTKIEINEKNAQIKNTISQPKEFIYIFKVKSKGSVHSLANSQFKSKLRCDIFVEIVPFTEKQPKQPSKLIISFISKFLFYVNILHDDKFYLLKTEHELDIFSNKYPQNESNLIFFQGSFEIIENFQLPDNSNYFNEKNENQCFDLKLDFVSSMKATLIEKRLVPNFFQSDNQFDDILIHHYHLILPNKQFKLVVTTLDTNEKVTIFFDTRYSIYPICVLPGIEIQIRNLIKKGDRVYKSSSALEPLSFQSFGLLSLKNEQDPLSKEKLIVKKRMRNDYLFDLDFSFCSFYQFNDRLKDFIEKPHLFNIKLLFRNSKFCQVHNDGFIKIYGQIVKIYELNLRLKCKICSNLISSCNCETKNEKKSYNFEFSTSLLVDDHSSTIRLNYSNLNIDLKSKQSNFFYLISDFLNKILSNLNEIKMIPVPSHINSNESNSNELDRTSKVYQNIKEKLNDLSGFSADQNNSDSNGTINNSILSSSLNNHDSSFIFENVVKLDIYKTLYDYLNFNILDKHFLFYIDINDLDNLRELGNSYENNPKKLNQYFRISDFYSNKQYKSVLNLKCENFLPTEIGFADF